MSGRQRIIVLGLFRFPRPGILRPRHVVENGRRRHEGRICTLLLRIAQLERADLRPRTHVVRMRQRQHPHRPRPSGRGRNPRIPHVPLQRPGRAGGLGRHVPERGQGQQHHQAGSRPGHHPVGEEAGPRIRLFLPRLLDALDGSLLRRRYERRHSHHPRHDAHGRHGLAASGPRAEELRPDHPGLPRRGRGAALLLGALRRPVRPAAQSRRMGFRRPRRALCRAIRPVVLRHRDRNVRQGNVPDRSRQAFALHRPE